MTEPTASPQETVTPMLCWTWCHPRKGTLATVVKPDGEMQQGRQHPKDDEIFFAKLGRIPAMEASRLYDAARQLPLTGGVPQAFSTGEPECVEARLLDAAGERALRVAVSDLPGQPALAEFRKAIIAARKTACGGFLAWNSIAGRMTFLFSFIVLMMCYWLIRDSRRVNQLEKTAQRMEATVTEHSGKNGFDPDKFIKVKFEPPGGVGAEAKIAAYLSAENWDAAKPGSTVRIWRDPATGEAWVENDLLRWQHDKKWVFILPLGLALIGLALCTFLSRYRVGVHADGQEFLMQEDRVSGDDKDMAISRTSINAGKMLYYLIR